MPEGADSASVKKYTEQSDENISRRPRKFQERKGKGYRSKQNAWEFWRENAGIRRWNRSSRKKKAVRKVCKWSKTSWPWQSDSTQCLIITFPSFANGIKVSYRNPASEIYSESFYLCWELWSPCFSVFW